ncbi:MAG: transposase [Planctomycetaceae bacterium]
MRLQSWVAYIQPPLTESSSPSDIVKYLARYLTGGPISDARLLQHEHGRGTLTARTGITHGGGDDVEEVNLPAQEFVRRWCLHILPPGFTKTRCYGGWSNHHCQRYMAECRDLLPSADDRAQCDALSPNALQELTDAASGRRRCPTCDGELELMERVHRTSWRDIFSGSDCPAWNTFRDRPG